MVWQKTGELGILLMTECGGLFCCHLISLEKAYNFLVLNSNLFCIVGMGRMELLTISYTDFQLIFYFNSISHCCAHPPWPHSMYIAESQASFWFFWINGQYSPLDPSSHIIQRVASPILCPYAWNLFDYSTTLLRNLIHYWPINFVYCWGFNLIFFFYNNLNNFQEGKDKHLLCIHYL